MGNSQRSGTNRFAGAGPLGAITVVGAVLTALAYVFAPVASVPLIGSMTAPALTSELTSPTSLIPLKFEPIAVLIMIVGAFWLLLDRRGASRRTGVAVTVLVASGYTVLAYLVPYAVLDSQLEDVGVTSVGISAATLTGAGFWLVLVGAVLTATGVALGLLGARRAQVSAV